MRVEEEIVAVTTRGQHGTKTPDGAGAYKATKAGLIERTGDKEQLGRHFVVSKNLFRDAGKPDNSPGLPVSSTLGPKASENCPELAQSRLKNLRNRHNPRGVTLYQPFRSLNVRE
jgi:hypothetical protein